MKAPAKVAGVPDRAPTAPLGAGPRADPDPPEPARPDSVLDRFWFEPSPLSRIAWLRVIVYGFIPIDVALSEPWVRGHARSGAALYAPLKLARALQLPAPTLPSTTVLAWALIASAVVAATGWRPRLTGSAAGLLYLTWMLVAMSFGKVDHDRLAFLVALAVLPTVGAATRASRVSSSAAGWALACIRVAVTMTYFYAGWAKIRFGGWDWPTGATLERALLRRGTPLSHWMLDQPKILVPMQFAMIGLELASPLILLARTDSARSGVAVGLWLFHLSVFAGVTIIFLPHCVALCAFLPLERLSDPPGAMRRVSGANRSGHRRPQRD